MILGPSDAVLDWLKAHGHFGHPCQKCWDAAYLRAVDDPSKAQTHHYWGLMKEAREEAIEALTNGTKT